MSRLQTTAEKPAPVRQIATLMARYIDHLGDIWVEGQIAELTRRPNTDRVWITLRVLGGEASLQVWCARTVIVVFVPPVVEGAKVVVHARFQYYIARGSLSLHAIEIRPVGLGDLLARLEQRRRLLAAEGLFDPRRKRTLPFLPRRVGLIAGRASAAERDVVENARRRWPAVEFRVENVPVQGQDAARHVMEALAALDRDASVDVIVIARGGGSIEDLLPFSDEGLVRAVAAASTPVVSAIGHEEDSPLLDYVADDRASTPTDAAKRIVPDVREQLHAIGELRQRTSRVMRARLDRELEGLANIRSRPVLAQPQRALDQRNDEIRELHARARRSLHLALDRAGLDIEHRVEALRALSPLSTLRRGYAVLQNADGEVVASYRSVQPRESVSAMVSDGSIHATVTRTEGRDE
jgi:exodeoxyribonuclease VII large subunit